LLQENEQLQLKMQQMERDSIDVIIHLKKEINSAQKESQIVQEQLREVCMVVCMLTVRHRVWLYVCSP
jgi:hypothetical protein